MVGDRSSKRTGGLVGRLEVAIGLHLPSTRRSVMHMYIPSDHEGVTAISTELDTAPLQLRLQACGSQRHQKLGKKQSISHKLRLHIQNYRRGNYACDAERSKDAIAVAKGVYVKLRQLKRRNIDWRGSRRAFRLYMQVHHGETLRIGKVHGQPGEAMPTVLRGLAAGRKGGGPNQDSG